MKSTKVDGKEYQSQRQAALRHGKSAQLVHARIKAGMDVEEAYNKEIAIEKKEITVNGKTYPSFRAACRGEGISYGTAFWRYQNGYELDKIFAKGKQISSRITAFKHDFPSRAEACRYYGVNSGSVTWYMRKKGVSLEEAIRHYYKGAEDIETR